MTAHDDLRKTLAGYQQASQTYEKIAHFPAARKAAADFVLEELGENGEVEAQILRNPETPIETVAQGLGISLGRRKQKLEELVDNKFDEIFKDENIKKERLKVSLLSYEPKENVSGKYKELADYHNIYRNNFLYQNKENKELLTELGIDPRAIGLVLNNALNDVVKYYEAQYKEENGDSDEIKQQKELLKDFFLSLYVRYGKPVRDGENLVLKYLSINKDKLEKFEESLKTKEALADYIKATLPEDKNIRFNFLRRLVG